MQVNIMQNQTPPLTPFDYSKHRTEILSIATHIGAALDLVQLIRPIISVDALLKEGVTDLNKINGALVVQVSQTLLNDYKVFMMEAKSIGDHLNDYVTRADQIYHHQLKLDEVGEQGVLMEGMNISQKYQHWYLRYTGMIIPLMNDLITLINKGRNDDRQIQLINFETQEIQ